MSYLIDTNVISETIRRQPDRFVISWFEGLPAEALFISVLSLGEIRKGVEKLADKKRREILRSWLEHELTAWFHGRVLPVDFAVADRWGRLLAAMGRPVPTVDSLLAATALHYELRLVTRNAGDFSYPGLEVINPWQTGI